MNHTNNETNQSLEWSLTDFEQKLRARSLGSGPCPRDELMYQCGHAAGVAATQRELQVVNRRWRCVAMAGSLLALVSVSSQLLSLQADRNGASTYSKTQYPASIAEAKSAAHIDSDAWLRQLIDDRPASQQASGVLRASAQTLPNTTTDRLDIPEVVGQDDQSMILRPNDFPFFL